MTRPPPWLRLLALSLVTAAAPVRADDWPQWRGPDRTGRVPAGVPVPTTLPTAPPVVWKATVGYGLASPIVAGGRIFYLDNTKDAEVVHAAEAGTGKELWSAPLDDAFKDGQSPAGPRCTPLADGDRVYAQSCRGELRCLSAADGKVVWRTNYVKDFGATFIGEKGKAEGATRHGYNAAPVVDGDHLIALAGGANGAAVVCFDKRTGAVTWKAGDDIPAYAAPVVATIGGTKQVVAFTVAGVVGRDAADGRELWRFPVKTALGRHVTTPVVAGDLVVVASHQAGLIGVRVARDGDAFKAERAWVEKASAVNFASPVAVGDYLYGVGPDQNFFCADLRTGQQAWSKDGYFTNADKAHAGLIVMGENILALTDGGDLVLFAADPKAFREVGRAPVAGAHWSIPAYAGGRLYVRDARELRCLQLLPGAAGDRAGAAAR